MNVAPPPDCTSPCGPKAGAVGGSKKILCKVRQKFLRRHKKNRSGSLVDDSRSEMIFVRPENQRWGSFGVCNLPAKTAQGPKKAPHLPPPPSRDPRLRP